MKGIVGENLETVEIDANTWRIRLVEFLVVVETTEHASDFDRGIAEQLFNLLVPALHDVRYTNIDSPYVGRIVVHGTTFEFYAHGQDGLACGRAVSPDPGSVPAHLVRVGRTIASIAQSDGETQQAAMDALRSLLRTGPQQPN